ncbi:MAG: methyltransferase domain-containing protein, partial [Myxococcales bacterium]|nr:methyltransferase domain-containing protein [Myxococcales bacterium]
SGACVRVVMTRAARRFVSRGALEAITHAAVPTRLWSRDPNAPVPHIELGQWADTVMVAPASATTLSRVASGDCSDVLSALCIATRAPVLFVPSMNEQMWRAPSIERSVATLQQDGHAFVRPHYGVEVADKPGQRGTRLGGMLAAAPLVRALAVWLETRRPDLFRAPIDWDALYGGPEELPWLSAGLDEVTRGLLSRHAPPPGRLLDLGCGIGAQTHAAAALGYTAVGVDSSATALSRASAAGNGPLFLKADVLDLGFETRFDVLLDRGTLHTLQRSELSRYAATLARVARDGAIFLVIHDGPGASASTLKLEPHELAERLPAFELVESHPMTLRNGEEGRASCTVFRRRALVSA